MSDFVYCLNSSTIRPVPILDKIRIAGEAGYAAIELWHEDIDLHLSRGGSLAGIRETIDNCGLQVPTTIMLKDWFDTTGATHRRALDECRRRMEQAAAVGAVHCIGGPPLGPDIDYRLGADNYTELLETGIREFGVRPAMEYLGFAQKFRTIEDALEIITRCGHPDATIVLDPFHCFRGGGPIESIGLLHVDQSSSSAGAA